MDRDSTALAALQDWNFGLPVQVRIGEIENLGDQETQRESPSRLNQIRS